MKSDSSSESKPPPSWLLRRPDQAVVAVLVLAGLAATVGWWVAHGGCRGELVELEALKPRTARFLVDLNQADWPELAMLPRIGETLARRIVESRERDGPFLHHEDLMRVRGIGPKTLERIRPYLRPIAEKAAAAREHDARGDRS